MTISLSVSLLISTASGVAALVAPDPGRLTCTDPAPTSFAEAAAPAMPLTDDPDFWGLCHCGWPCVCQARGGRRWFPGGWSRCHNYWQWRGNHLGDSALYPLRPENNTYFGRFQQKPERSRKVYVTNTPTPWARKKPLAESTRESRCAVFKKFQMVAP